MSWQCDVWHQFWKKKPWRKYYWIFSYSIIHVVEFWYFYNSYWSNITNISSNKTRLVSTSGVFASMTGDYTHSAWNNRSNWTVYCPVCPDKRSHWLHNVEFYDNLVCFPSLSCHRIIQSQLMSLTMNYNIWYPFILDQWMSTRTWRMKLAPKYIQFMLNPTRLFFQN